MKNIDITSYKNKLVELHLVSNDESEEEIFSLGYIIKDLQGFFLFLSVSETGTLESIQLRNKEYIAEIEENSDYLKSYEFFISYTKEKNIFDSFDLSSMIELEKIGTVNEALISPLQLKRTVSVITSKEDSILTGRILLLGFNNIVLSLLDYENMKLNEKESIMFEEIICIDLVNAENFLYDRYLESKE